MMMMTPTTNENNNNKIGSEEESTTSPIIEDTSSVSASSETRIVSIRKIRGLDSDDDEEQETQQGGKFEALSLSNSNPSSGGSTPMRINFQQDQEKFKDCFKLYSWGPLIINTDGTLNRVSNWHSMTEGEQASAFRLICARNKRRVEALRVAYNEKFELNMVHEKEEGEEDEEANEQDCR